uniref:NADH-ubiquinone oxidoreductase chain 2 n=1 Tax=Scolopendra dehaani TaxID=2609776 RepID=A0A343JMK9_SCODE|nr:NAHD dehydrogenase subunit 2 [Scolopendra dehaani]
MLGTLMAMSSSSWLLIWMGLEINLMSMITLLTKSKLKSESPMKYFMTQTLASSTLMLGFILLLSNHQWLLFYMSHTIILLSLAMKMASAPLHFWLPSTMDSTSWYNCLILVTWQKIAPLIIMMNFISNMIMILIISSAIIGPMGGYNQLSTKKIMAYSSIGHLAWMMSAMMLNNSTMINYLIIYMTTSSTFILFLLINNINHTSSLMNINKPNMMNTLVFLNLLSMGGMPPLLGFMPKWYVIKLLMSKMMMPLSLMLILSSLFTLFYYMRMSYFSFMMSSNTQQNIKMKMNTLMMFILSPSIMMFPLILF